MAEPASAGTPAPTQPSVARQGIWVMVGLLGLVIAAGTAFNGASEGYGKGLVTTLDNLGFGHPAVASYTLMLLSPLFFETAYPLLRRRLADGTRSRRVVENLHAHAPYLVVIASVMLVMRFENIFDLWLTARVGYDFTPAVHGLEGDVVYRFQAALRSVQGGLPFPALDYYLIFIYIVAYAFYHVLAMVLFAATGRTVMLKRFLVTWSLIYLVALPFYVFAPVNEVWTTDPRCGVYDGYPATLGLLHDDCTAQGGIVYAISSINNCFPSLHNAFAWALPMLLWKSGWRRTSRRLWPLASSISLATLYLGIHWFTDLVAGVLLAWVATSVAVRLDFTVTPRLGFTGIRWRAPQPDATEPRKPPAPRGPGYSM